MDIYAATQAFNAAATKAWITCGTVNIPGCPGWAFNGPASPTGGFFVSITYNGREIARADGDEADPMSIHFYPTPRKIVDLDDFKWILRMIRQGFLLSLDSELNHWLANCSHSSYHWDLDPGIGVTAPAEA